MKRNKEIGAIIVTALLGILMIAGQFRELKLYEQLTNTGQLTEATIISRHAPSPGARRYYLEYAYTVQGAEFRFTQAVSEAMFERLRTASTVSILYNQGDTAISRIKGNVPPVFGLTSGWMWGLLFLLASVQAALFHIGWRYKYKSEF
jgi:hypothetical protein